MNKHFLLKDLRLYFMCACEGWNCEDGLEVKRGIRVGREPEPFQQASALRCWAFIFPGTCGEAEILQEQAGIAMGVEMSSFEAARALFMAHYRDHSDRSASSKEKYVFALLDCRTAEPRTASCWAWVSVRQVTEGMADWGVPALNPRFQLKCHLRAQGCRCPLASSSGSRASSWDTGGTGFYWDWGTWTWLCANLCCVGHWDANTNVSWRAPEHV